MIQIVAILFRAVGIYRIVGLYLTDYLASVFAMVHFLSIWGIYSALDFDFQNNVIVAMLVPWFIYYWKLKKKQAIVFCLASVIIAAWVSVSVIQHDKSMWYDNTRWAFFEGHHFKPDLNRAEIMHILDQVPDDSSVSVTGRLSPYLERRENYILSRLLEMPNM